ncbi:hypothetical protein JAAARDRAFT_190437 [Jaapia argillacea MUCL 33604]|uniref:SnoaL-like domain-containing protein n=1 Tax=Jaapia argillacea MUCL 33604 TaxID=933084 RepID=A0A067Q6A2_9AGAM|nr:hypothetical protein JAAARDRAFT_190437 [Jaapia argillacea MUCL 33604]
MSPSRKHLLAAAQALCQDFARQEDTDTLLSHFSTTHQPTAIEHGDPSLASFLGRPFTGTQGVRKYFELLQELLTYKDMKFSEYVVDTEVNKVSVKGRAEFTWTSTGQSWKETFTYTLDFDQDLKVTDYQVWADSGAAYLASKGQLEEVQRASKE